MTVKAILSVLATSGLIYAANATAMPIQAVTFTHTSSDGYYSASTATLGYEFRANAMISISDLGAFDKGGDGLLDSHQVGLFDKAGNLLISTTVTSSDPLVGDFRYASITPYRLEKDDYYYIGAADFGGNSDEYVVPADQSPAAEITYIRNAFVHESGLHWPDKISYASNTGYFGGNFRFVRTVDVSESSALELFGLGLGLIGLGVFARCKRHPV